MLRPYFQLDKVIEGVLGLANKLYGITFKENKEIPVYHPDVKAYEVFDKTAVIWLCSMQISSQGKANREVPG